VNRERTAAMELPASVREPFRSAIVEACSLWTLSLADDLVSLVLFGSVARGDARDDSDIDMLIVARGFPRSLAERRAPLLDRWRAHRTVSGLPEVPWNLVTKTPEEARNHSPLYLDMVEDGIVLHDLRGFFAEILSAMRSRMQELGSRRVFLDDGSWYWDLKPDYQFGDIVEI
jgi:predicted nucleotidyltransferase